MEKRGFFSLYVRYLFPTLIFLLLVFSCKSGAQSNVPSPISKITPLGTEEKVQEVDEISVQEIGTEEFFMDEESEDLGSPLDEILVREESEEEEPEEIEELIEEEPKEFSEFQELPLYQEEFLEDVPQVELPSVSPEPEEPLEVFPEPQEPPETIPELVISELEPELPPQIPELPEVLPVTPLEEPPEAFPEPPELPEIIPQPEPVLPPQVPAADPPPEAVIQSTVPPPLAPPVPQQAPEPPPQSPPPSPPPFIAPAEPETAPLLVEPVPESPLPELPGRILPEPAGEEIVFSRVIRVTVGQMMEIPFRGTGWVFLGELGNRRGVSYDSRRLDIEAGTIVGQSFIFRAETAGTYILKFYKQDFIQDYIINDHVQIIVGERFENSEMGRAPADQGRVIAEPRWPQPTGSTAQTGPVTEAADSANEVIFAAETQDSSSRAGAEEIVTNDSIPPAAPPSSAVLSPEEFVRRARQEFDSGQIEQALGTLDAMRQVYPLGTDEAWWLYGQLLEANSPGRDIRLALEYYRRLVREYPQSPLVGDAQRRIAYLERFYLNIR